MLETALVIFIAIVGALGVGALALFSYHLGVKVGTAVKDEKPIPKIVEPKETEEEPDQTLTMLEKIFNYDYTNPPKRDE